MIGAHLKEGQASLHENIAAIAAVFHTHRLEAAFRAAFAAALEGTPGIYALCISMAEALTDWELANGGPMAYESHDVTWSDVVDDLVDELVTRALSTGVIPSARDVLPELPILEIAQERA